MVLRQSAASLAGTGWRGSFALVTTVNGELGATAVTTVGLSSAARATGASSEPHSAAMVPRRDKAKTGVQPDIMIPVDQS